jgi:cell division protein FtsQ
MDGRGRLAEPLNGDAMPFPAAGQTSGTGGALLHPLWHRTQRFARRWFLRLHDMRVPRGAGVIASALLILSSAGYGAFRGGHGPDVMAALTDGRDAAANAVGFRITSIALAGGKQVTREEILTAAGVTGRTSLLFLDAGAARARLKSNPWIAEATILKLYPGQLRIDITEREAFALWQKDRQVAVISRDGTVVEAFVDRRFAKLPFVVGAGAESKAREFLAVLDKYPALRDQTKASVLVADRRWNLQLKNGIEIKLPEQEIERALETLVTLDRDKKLLSRDIAAVDLRLSDRVSVRLSDEAHAVRQEQLKPKPKRRGGDA